MGSAGTRFGESIGFEGKLLARVRPGAYLIFDSAAQILGVSFFYAQNFIAGTGRVLYLYSPYKLLLATRSSLFLAFFQFYKSVECL